MNINVLCVKIWRVAVRGLRATILLQVVLNF